MGRASPWLTLLLLPWVLCLWLVPVPTMAAEPLSFTLESDETPTQGCPGEVRPVQVRLRNTGDVTWEPALRDRLAYHWLLESGGSFERDGERTLLPGQVASGDAVDLSARLEFPTTPGTYRLQWAMVREQVRWYPTQDVPQREVIVAGDPPPLAYAIEVGTPPRFESGEVAQVEVRLRNTGCAAWRTAFGDALSYHWRDSSGAQIVEEGLRTPLPDVEAGASATVRARVEAPKRPGSYRLEFEPVREGLTWFGPAVPPSDLEVEVEPGPLLWSVARIPEFQSLHANQVVTIPLAIRNEGRVAWSAPDGDRISYRWRDSEGKLVGEGMRTPLRASIGPGEEVEIGLRVAAPDVPGTYRFEPEPVREHVRWFGPPIRGPAGALVEVEEPWLAFSVVDIDGPWWFWVGRTQTVTVTVRNEGASPWSPDRADRLSYRWRDDTGAVVVPEGRRTEIPREVAPGDTLELEAEVVGPARSGAYVLEFEMVREHVAWFGPPKGANPATVDISVHFESTMLGALLAGAVALVIGAWRHARTAASMQRASGWIWPAWLAACIWLVSEAFADLSGIEFWDWGRVVAISCGAMLAAMLAAVGRSPRVLGLSAAWFIAVLVVADLAYAKFFGSLVPLTALAAAHHLKDAGGSVLSLLEPAHVWVLSLPATGLALAWGVTGLERPRRRWQRWGPTLVFCVAAIPAVWFIGGVTASDVGQRVFSEERNAGRLGVVGAHVFQVGRALRSLGGRGTLSAQERQDVDDFYAVRANDRAGPREFDPVPGSNVILIQVEALQHWALMADVQERPVMPFLRAALERDAVSFDAVYDQTAQGRTSDAEYLALASNHALAEGALSFLREDASFVTVAHVLRDAGYATLSAHPYRRGFWNRAALHPRYGFDTSLFMRELGSGPEVGWGLADGPFLERMGQRLATTQQPFFAFLITLSLHHPYDHFPVALRELDMGDLEDSWVGNYLHAMHHFDRALEAFFDQLRSDGLMERTVVLIYGDHITGMGEPPAVLELAGMHRWDPSTPGLLRRVPVVAWVPGEPGAGLYGHRGRVGGHIDIGPTVLDLLGMPAPASFVGRSLYGGPSWVALPSGGAVTDDRMLMVGGQGIAPDGACFDVPRGSARPREDCDALGQDAGTELSASRAVLDHDLFGTVGAASSPRAP